jgi:hypothetical protein
MRTKSTPQAAYLNTGGRYCAQSGATPTYTFGYRYLDGNFDCHRNGNTDRDSYNYTCSDSYGYSDNGHPKLNTASYSDPEINADTSASSLVVTHFQYRIPFVARNCWRRYHPQIVHKSRKMSCISIFCS